MDKPGPDLLYLISFKRSAGLEILLELFLILSEIIKIHFHALVIKAGCKTLSCNKQHYDDHVFTFSWQGFRQLRQRKIRFAAKKKVIRGSEKTFSSPKILPFIGKINSMKIKVSSNCLLFCLGKHEKYYSQKASLYTNKINEHQTVSKHKKHISNSRHSL